MATKSNDDGLEIRFHKTPLSKASTLLSNCSSSYQFNSMALAGHSAAHTPQP
jgi:hypothetical protein